MAKQVRLNVFQMNTPSHSWAGLWRHPRDQSRRHTTLDYWTELAKTAERGLFDGVFIADGLGFYDVYEGSIDAALATGAQAPSCDPLLVVPAMAAVTQHLGFGLTANLTYEHPFQFARRFSTLDHLTQGRVGWNIVTGYLKSTALGMGQQKVREHDQRYEAGDDFLDAVYKLWEGSWEDGALNAHAAAGEPYVDVRKVHRVQHDGPYYKVDGVHLSPPSPQRVPVLYQAGTSRRGKQFAGQHAECVFLNGQTPAIVAQAVRDIREQAVAQGRRPDDVQVFLGATVIVAPTREEAEALRDEYARYIDPVGQLALLSGWTGIDLSRQGLDEPVGFVKTNSLQSMVENITVRSERPLTPRDLIGFDETGGRGPFIVGSPADVADGLLDWLDRTGVDGFNLMRVVQPESLDAFVDLVVPELQRRGRYKTAYDQGTLREKLFPGRGPWLPAQHPAASHRRTPATAA